jgi:hypothetical protein
MLTDPIVVAAICCHLVVQVGVVYLLLHLLRTDGLLTPATSLYAGIVAFWGPSLPLFAAWLSGKTLLPASALPPSTVAASFFALALMSVCLMAGTMVHRMLRQPAALHPLPRPATAGTLLVFSCIYISLYTILLFGSADTRSYLIDIFRFFVAPDAAAYQRIRRVDYAESFLIDGIIGRLRYSVNALMFVLMLICLIQLLWHKMFAIMICLVPGFLLICSISKLPYIYFMIYALISVVAFNHEMLADMSRQLRVFLGGIFVFVVGLLALYSFQYEGLENQSFGRYDLIQLAIYRVFVANYDGLLAYIYAYPGILPFTGFPSLTGISQFFGFDPVDHSIEIVKAISPQSFGLTSYPTIFIGAAYADLGWLGIAILSVFVGFYVSWLGGSVERLRCGNLRNAAAVVLTLNTQFFLAVPATTTLFTYGMVTVLIAAKLLDILLQLLIRPDEIAALSPGLGRMGGDGRR